MLTVVKALIFSTLLSTAWAEYRVYQYYVKNKHPYSLDQESYLVTSTLDPVSYISYHGGKNSLSVDMLRSWMCYGHTGDRSSHCHPPKESIELGQKATP